MKLHIKRIIAALSALCFINTAIPSAFAESADTERLAAFPGAEGGGMYASGARDTAAEIYHVTKLDDDNSTGTLRDAVSQSNRIIVFDVAGNIELKNALNIKGSNLTILGQTAPGDGICIKNNTTTVLGSNVIMRYLRFRMGDECAVEDDSLGGRGLNDVIIDHCSISWSVDECASFYENTNFTMQWCIISESLKQSVHAKGSHGYGGIWGGKNASFHHNLISSHDSRNPRIATAGIDEAYDDATKQTDLTDLRNNVLYNWGGNSAYGGENGAPVNIVNCYYKPGPSTGSHKSRIYQISAKAEGDNTGTNSLNRPGWGTDIYVSGNIVEGSAEVTEDNAKGVEKDANSVKYSIWTDSNITDAEKSVHNRYIADYPVTTQTAEDAYNSVLANAGASISRDATDTRIINDVKNGTGSLINSQSEVGGYSVLNGTKAKDSDNDGIPNEWEDSHALNKLDGSDALKKADSGYTYIEEYANALADGSYVRDTAYDPDVPDYKPSDDTDTPSPTERPKKLINSWTAAKGDEQKAAGEEFMPGLSGVIGLSRAVSLEANYDDGTSLSFAVSHKDTSGGWDAANGCAKGTAMKYTAPQDGVFTIYGYSVSNTKTFYIMPEGAKSTDSCIYKKECVGAEPVLAELNVTKGSTYYFYIDGSKMRFCAAKLEEYIDPYTVTKSADGKSFTVTNNTDEILQVAAITAVYDSSGFLTDAKIEELNTAPAKSQTVTVPGDGAAVKLFIWNSVSGMKPLTAAQ